MHRQDIGPRMFGNRLGYNRAVSVTDPDRWLVLAGHESRGPDGEIVHVRDLCGQIETTFDRLAETLAEAGFTFAHVVQLRYFAVDVADVTRHFDVITARLEQENCRPATALVGVTALSDPDMLIEIEGLAVR
ncbi:Rid family hydrolase [Embleya sp. NPDC020886]|uniref:Rid family hydrolase n=1 Tax=Embleya sp. NPDC020886 TaxID=3363980 RepID=UPI0037959A08